MQVGGTGVLPLAKPGPWPAAQQRQGVARYCPHATEGFVWEGFGGSTLPSKKHPDYVRFQFGPDIGLGQGAKNQQTAHFAWFFTSLYRCYST